MKIANLQPYHEADVIKGCIDMNPRYQKLLYEHFASKMFALCMRYAHDYHTAEDLLQDGFIKVFRYIKNFRQEGSFEGWVRRIFVNTSIEHFRKAVKVFPILDDEDHHIDIHDDSHFDHLDVEDLLGMVQKLSPGYRTIFNLYAIEGYNHKEISEMLDISEGTSKSQLARARVILKKKILHTQKIPAEGVS